MRLFHAKQPNRVKSKPKQPAPIATGPVSPDTTALEAEILSLSEQKRTLAAEVKALELRRRKLRETIQSTINALGAAH